MKCTYGHVYIRMYVCTHDLMAYLILLTEQLIPLGLFAIPSKMNASPVSTYVCKYMCTGDCNYVSI